MATQDGPPSNFRALPGSAVSLKANRAGNPSRTQGSDDDQTERTMTTERTPLLGANSAENGSANSPSATPAAAGTPLRTLIPAIGSLWLVLFFAALDGTVASTLLAPISSAFNASEKAAWLGTAFLLSVCAFTPLYGRLSDAGRSTAMLTALFFFTTGTAACALAPSIEALLIARAVAGAGAGGILTCASIIMTDLVTLRQRGLLQGLGNIIFATGGALGGVYGGWINDAYSWRAAFSLQVPFLLVASALIVKFIKIPVSEEHKGRTLKDKLLRIDWLGSALLLSGIGGLLVMLSTLSTGGGVNGLPSLSELGVWVPALMFVVSALAFLYVEAYVAKEPVLPLRLLTRKTPACIAAVYFVTSCSYYSLFFWYPLYFQAVRGYSASVAGMHIIPMAVSTAAGSLIAGLLMKATGKYWILQTFSSILPVIFVGLLISWTPYYPGKFGEYATVCPAGFGLSSVYTTLLVALMASVSRAEFGIANGMIYLFRTLGQVVGVGISGAMLQGVLASRLRTRITGDNAQEIIRAIQHSIEYVDTLPKDLQRAARESYSDALRMVFIFVTVLNFVAFLCGLPIQENSMDGQPIDEQNDRRDQPQEA